MFVYDVTVVQFVKMLHNLERWLDKARENAESRKYDLDTLLQARLAPDQYPLVRQIQASCDGAKFAAARLSGREPPSHPDTEQTIEEVRARIASTISFLESLEAKDFAGAEERPITLPFMPGKVMRGSDYLTEMVLPNVYFHIVTAYAILRHNGVSLGKPDYIGSLKTRDA